VAEAAGKCVRCDYSQADDAKKKRARGLDPPPFLRVMLFVDKHVRHQGRWGNWQGSKFIRGGRSGDELYWACDHCHAPGEAIQLVEKGYGL
jgi:hypothetical protein